MLAIAGEADSTFLADKVVGDFGCGPRGSLAWATQARERIGIDVLADDYAREFDLSQHGMRYVTSTEENIPLPDGYCDILYSVNALDHVKDLECMCRELFRILKPGGEFIASINLGEPPTACEPHCLTEKTVHMHLLKHLDVKSYRLAGKGPSENLYKYLLDGGPLLNELPEGNEGFLWVRAVKPLT